MKKLFLTLVVALFAMGAQAQEKGDFALGVKGGLSFAKIQFGNDKENYTRGGAGAFAQYNFTNHFRVELEGIYHFKKNHFSDITAGLNLQYLFNLSENVKLYPQVGYALAFTKTDTYTEYYGNNSSITVEGGNSRDGGVQLGLGIQFNVGEKAFILGDYKFQPGIFGDGHVINVGVGFRL